MKIEMLEIEDKLYQILKSFNPSYFTNKTDEINKKLLGLWVSYLGGDRVVQNNNKFLICKQIEEAQIIDSNE
jgi:hypothetical protein|tara:strand:+ start:205 stop:420 length:216 start_codon:yes stop_codon:yes gene_type:complete